MNDGWNWNLGIGFNWFPGLQTEAEKLKKQERKKPANSKNIINLFLKKKSNRATQLGVWFDWAIPEFNGGNKFDWCRNQTPGSLLLRK